MEQFTKLFGDLLAFVYHCFDRIVILGHLPLLTRPENIVHFFRDVHGVGAITKEVLRQRTIEYNQWVEAFARNHPFRSSGLSQACARRTTFVPGCGGRSGTTETESTSSSKAWRSAPAFGRRCPKYPASDPDYRIVAKQRSRYTHYYFYIRDQLLGPMALRVGSFLPFSITYYLNGHHFIEQQLRAAGVQFRKDHNAFLWVADAQALQAAADGFSAKLIRTRLDYWSLLVGPKFSKKDRQAVNLGRYYSLQQVEYCRNLIFRRNFPIHKLFERSCDLGLLRLSADRISQVFGWRVHQRLSGKLSSVLEKTEHGHHVLRSYAKNAVMRMYEKFSTFLRLEALSNNLKDFGLNKGLDNLDKVRLVLRAVTDRFAAFEAQALDVHVDFPLFQRLALPIPRGAVKIPGIKLHDARMLRLMEVLLHTGTKISGWRTAEIHQAILSSFSLTADSYPPHPTPL
jgi:hypothetical protein